MKWLASILAVLSLITTVAAAKDKEPEEWVEQKKAEFLEIREADGDSFGMTVVPNKNRVKRTYRLYGVDCPETDARGGLLAQRIADQAQHFGVKPEDIPAWGKKAAAFTLELLKNGKPLVRTLGPMGQEAPGDPDNPQRRYALIEVTAPDGSRRMLHELLIENGLARAHGKAAPWPERKRHRGEKDARDLFMHDLERMEKKAKDSGLGLWKKAPAPGGRFR
jgi:endonuclease YncB( thermonuclease family)